VRSTISTLNTKVNQMKRLLIGLGATLLVAMATTNATAQRGRGGAGQERGGPRGIGVQSRAGNQGLTPHSKRGSQGGISQRGDQGRQPSGALSAIDESPDLLRMREEEKLARDVYTKLASTSKQPIFRNIARAESQHMRSIEQLVRSRDTGPQNLNDTPGVFTFPEYQQLYETLVANGTRSPLDALMVGAKIEEMDIADLRQILTQTADPQVRRVLEHLMNGSENHLRAFASQLSRQGASYNAEFLSQSDFDEIAGASAKGPATKGPAGKGRGQQFGRQAANKPGIGGQANGQGLGPRFGGQGGFGFAAQARNGQGGAGWRGGRGNGPGRGR
jgi:hypothetical protein